MKRMHRFLASDSMTRFAARLRYLGLSTPMIIFFALLALAPLIIRDEYVCRLLVMSLLFGAQAMAFDFTSGFIKVVNFGFAGFMGLGAYTSALLVIKLGLSTWLGFAGGAIVAGILGIATGLLTLRLRGIYAACMAWFVQLALMGLVTVNVNLTRAYYGLCVPPALDTTSTIPYFYILLPMAIGIYIVLSWIANSDIGLAFRAIGQDLLAARASGINPTRYKLINWTVACTFAGLLGGFYAHFLGTLTPDVMHFRHTVEVLAIAYIGGRGTLWGGLVAAFLMTPIFEYLKPLLEIRLIIYGFVLILVMILYPPGFAGIAQKIGRTIRRTR